MAESTASIRSTKLHHPHARRLQRRGAGNGRSAAPASPDPEKPTIAATAPPASPNPEKPAIVATAPPASPDPEKPAIAATAPPASLETNGQTAVKVPAGQTATLARASNEASARLPENSFQSIICRSKINNVRYLNKHFEAINRALIPGGTYSGCVETHRQFVSRLNRRYPAALRYPFHAAHFIVKRLLPKWKFSRRLYYHITKGKNRVISLPEVHGRLASCGFELIDHRRTDGLTWFTVRKIREPYYDMDPTFGPLVRLRREGLHGRIITIYKFRTMYPYSEYIQEYVFEQSGLDRGDKFLDDFRITRWGRLLRTYWIDEIPMLWNYLKRDLKLVGVRPISAQKLSLYTPELRKLRREIKPGLIPPYYADLPDSLEGMQESETRYILQYKKAPFRTDLRYFVKVIYNILIKGARSR